MVFYNPFSSKGFQSFSSTWEEFKKCHTISFIYTQVRLTQTYAFGIMFALTRHVCGFVFAIRKVLLSKPFFRLFSTGN